MTFVDLEGLTTSEAEFMAKLREYENSDTWLLFVNYGFSMETARSLYDKGLIDTSKQMGMPAARLKQPMTAEEAGAMTAWQPIETAPKDRTPVLVCVAGAPKSARESYYSPHACKWVNYHRFGRPTHWMPLPESPSPLTPKDSGK